MSKKIATILFVVLVFIPAIAKVKDSSIGLFAKIKGDFDKEFQKANAEYEKKVRPVIERADKQRRASIQRAGKKALARLERAAKDAQKINDEAEIERIDAEIAVITKLMEQNEPAVKVDEIYRIKYGSHRYLAICAPVNWHEAKEICEKMGGHLVYIETADEMAFLKKSIGNTRYLWVGATDEHKEGDWRWLNKRKVNPVFWAQGQPRVGNRYNFAWFGRGEIVNRRDKDILHGFICEWER